MRTRISSESPWEDEVGYSRAVIVGNQLFVSGTTATDEHGVVVAAGDMYGQARCILDKMARVLTQAGSCLDDVVRTCMYVTDIARWEEAARAHHECFHAVKPAATMVEVARLIHPDMLIEIEATAVIGSAAPSEQASR
jgi:enamine deaminase RidA (YjgF/YER057c/UK114 family)